MRRVDSVGVGIVECGILVDKCGGHLYADLREPGAQIFASIWVGRGTELVHAESLRCFLDRAVEFGDRGQEWHFCLASLAHWSKCNEKRNLIVQIGRF